LVWEWSYDAQGNLLWSKEPNGARTDYAYYAGTDRVWKITDALGYVWEYAYTSYGDVKRVKDPEGGEVQYVYDYELGEPAYGQVRKVIDALGRATEYAYYGADDTNLARRGQVKRVTVPGGYWREMDYGGAGWLVRREVQTANGSEVTTYTYDAWGRLRAIDYPRSADVRMGWDGENRRVWVQDGVGERRYEYDAWGRVTKQRGCCGSADGIEVVAVSASYDEAGRKTSEREERADGSAVRTISYTYDGLGRLKTVGDYRGAVVYHYEAGTGRLQREDYPNGSYVEYTYYGSDNPSQVGFVWQVEHKRSADESLLIGYEYTYDLLGRVVQSVERPSGDTTVYAYTPAGRLESEVRKGQVWYSRYYGYNLDGSRATVMRDDALNGTHWDVYVYDPVSGRLASVQDALTGEVHSFVWNPEGTLARWEQPSSYARVFGYDEEGRLVKIERDYGAGGVQVAYEYGYNSDGARVWKRDVLNGQEYRYVCRIGCGGVPMRLYNRVMSGGSWTSVEDYLPAGNALGYNGNWQYRHTGGELLMMGATGEPSGYYPMDSNGLAVQNAPAQPCICAVVVPTKSGR
jgi:YD repeat-containing protein